MALCAAWLCSDHGCHDSVIADGVVYIQGTSIAAVLPAAAPRPAGFEGTDPVATGGTIYPGLIELHNHLPYNILPLWHIPEPFHNRAQWRAAPEYRRRVRRPMEVLQKQPGLAVAIACYVECKSLFSGVTTSQGIGVYGSAKFYRGAVRPVEEPPVDPRMPPAQATINDPDDVDTGGVAGFWQRLQKLTEKHAAYIIHLSEGTDEDARRHFTSLRLEHEWAITPSLVGIHGTALTEADFEVLGKHRGAMVWSPLSNLLLYGDTARIAAARAAEVRIALGPDWSPSGSKNLLGEVKAARAYCDVGDIPIRDRDLVSMVTRAPADIVGWGAALGSIERGKRADLVVLDGIDAADPYRHFVRAHESAVRLVTVDGIARFGDPALFAKVSGAPAENREEATVAGASRMLDVLTPSENAAPDVKLMRFQQAAAMCREALQALPSLEAGNAPHLLAAFASVDARHAPGLRLDLDDGMEALPSAGILSFDAAAKPLEPIELDPPTVADDGDFLEQLAAQINLPAHLAAEIAELY